MAPKQNLTLLLNIGRGHTSAGLRFWHDVRRHNTTKLLEYDYAKRHFAYQDICMRTILLQ
jgi:hypothetical protein